MTASTQTAPRQLSFGKVPAAFAALALVAILALTVALVALNSSKAVAPTTGAKAAPPPAVIDHGTSNGEMSRYLAGASIDAVDHGARDEAAAAAAAAGRAPQQFGGWGGPNLNSVNRITGNSEGRGMTGPRLRAN